MKDFLSNNIKFVVIGFILIVIAMISIMAVNIQKEREAAKIQEQTDAEIKAQQELEQEEESETSDNLLIQMQSDLSASYGEAPEGFIWDVDGSLISLGDKNLSAEDVVYSYFRGLASLDMGSVAKYSRGSSVASTYEGYFDVLDSETDYSDQFTRNMYKQCLLSIQIEGIEDQTVFANNKQVFTVNGKMLDLTDKDFWVKDKEEIFKNLYLYDSDESDEAKGDIYLYDYILDYYKSDKVNLRDVSFDITVQKYPDLDSGWLVSIDEDVNNACTYKDGNLVVSYIQDMYRDVRFDMFEADEF